MARKVTAIGVAGGLGASYTIYERNWACGDCEAENYARRTRCWRCKAEKPEGGGGLVQDPQQAAGSDWKETIDPTSGHLYYYNTRTNETSWERPVEMGPAPMATGWFGRGAAGSKAARHYEKQNEKFLTRPARKQKDFIDTKQGYQEGADEYNIWYGRFIGDHWRYDRGKDPAETRCTMSTDAGTTKATDMKAACFCIQFCRGRCALGGKCSYLHRCPVITDDAALPLTKDVFGRDRHASHKDDMSGTGNFMSDSRTLYIGGLKHCQAENTEKIEKMLWKNFGEWGEVENINIIHRLAICFVRYRLRANAEFAKEAMSNQALDEDGTNYAEVINIRWAMDDPNPVAQASAKRANEDALVAIMNAKGVSTAPEEFNYPGDYQVPAAKRMRTDEPELPADVTAFPNTDKQYSAASRLHEQVVQQGHVAAEEQARAGAQQAVVDGGPDQLQASERACALDSVLDRIGGGD